MGKKKAIMIFSGSTKSHWIKYVTSLNMNVNPVDSYGMSSSFRILRTLGSVDSKFLQPGFQYQYSQVKDKAFNFPSYLHLKFVNGQERKYDMAISTFPTILQEINYINELVEYERAMAGQDDELDDEV
jgi:hypothetical protein